MKKKTQQLFQLLIWLIADKHLQISLYEIFSIDLKPIEPASYVLFVCLFVMDPGAF